MNNNLQVVVGHAPEVQCKPVNFRVAEIVCCFMTTLIYNSELLDHLSVRRPIGWPAFQDLPMRCVPYPEKPWLVFRSKRDRA